MPDRADPRPARCARAQRVRVLRRATARRIHRHAAVRTDERPAGGRRRDQPRHVPGPPDAAPAARRSGLGQDGGGGERDAAGGRIWAPGRARRAHAGARRAALPIDLERVQPRARAAAHRRHEARRATQSARHGGKRGAVHRRGHARRVLEVVPGTEPRARGDRRAAPLRRGTA